MHFLGNDANKHQGSISPKKLSKADAVTRRSRAGAPLEQRMLGALSSNGIWVLTNLNRGIRACLENGAKRNRIKPRIPVKVAVFSFAC